MTARPRIDHHAERTGWESFHVVGAVERPSTTYRRGDDEIRVRWSRTGRVIGGSITRRRADTGTTVIGTIHGQDKADQVIRAMAEPMLTVPWPPDRSE